jgi:hypothetical protein
MSSPYLSTFKVQFTVLATFFLLANWGLGSGCWVLAYSSQTAEQFAST